MMEGLDQLEKIDENFLPRNGICRARKFRIGFEKIDRYVFSNTVYKLLPTNKVITMAGTINIFFFKFFKLIS